MLFLEELKDVVLAFTYNQLPVQPNVLQINRLQIVYIPWYYFGKWLIRLYRHKENFFFLKPTKDQIFAQENEIKERKTVRQIYLIGN